MRRVGTAHQPDRNITTYTSAGIVRHYAQLEFLQPAEAAIIEGLKDQLPSMTMLDIGVGGGRTTQHFAPLVKQYVGVDYSPEMIAACQKRFKNVAHSVSFEVGDARDLSQFEDSSFDFILFSYNGIDYVDHIDRQKVLAEVKRVGKPGGYFFFSSHNLQALERALSWKHQLSFNPIQVYVNLVVMGLFWWLNRPLNRQTIEKSEHLIVRDESHNFRLDTYYIRAAEQIKQLPKGFNQVEIYPWQSTERVVDMDAAIMARDLWLYYLCRID
ncbi:MAG: class I SAM-dependent methyltransferase [Cyanobacteria bacterium P01_D01_bin.156]